MHTEIMMAWENWEMNGLTGPYRRVQEYIFRQNTHMGWYIHNIVCVCVCVSIYQLLKEWVFSYDYKVCK